MVWIQGAHIGSRYDTNSVFPAFMMLLKLDTILEEIIRSRTAAATVKVQEETATRASRRRKEPVSRFESF